MFEHCTDCPCIIKCQILARNAKPICRKHLSLDKWQDWKANCLLRCDLVSNCAFFAQGKAFYERGRDAYQKSVEEVGKAVC